MADWLIVLRVATWSHSMSNNNRNCCYQFCDFVYLLGRIISENDWIHCASWNRVYLYSRWRLISIMTSLIVSTTSLRRLIVSYNYSRWLYSRCVEVEGRRLSSLRLSFYLLLFHPGFKLRIIIMVSSVGVGRYWNR